MIQDKSKRKKVGENAEYWLAYCQTKGLFHISQAGKTVTGAWDGFTTIGGSADLDELIRFVHGVNGRSRQIKANVELIEVEYMFFYIDCVDEHEMPTTIPDNLVINHFQGQYF